MKHIPRLQKATPAKGMEDWHHYLPVPDKSIRRNFYLTSAGRSTVWPGETYPKHQHPRLYHFSWEEGRTLPEFQLLLLTEGHGKFQSKDTGEINIGPGQAVLLCPDVWHRYRPDRESGWTEKWVQFDGPFAVQLMEQGIISPAKPVINPGDFRAAEDQFNRLLDLIHHAPTVNTISFSLEALAVLASVLREVPVTASRFHVDDPRQTDAIVAAALDYIWTQGGNVIDVPAVANAVGVTRRTLERHMVAMLGHGVLEEIINCRFARAERLLRSTSFSLKTIVHLSGFGSIENMRQVFMSRTNMSPLSYRGEAKNENEPEAERRKS